MNTETKVWKRIPGYSKYEASTDGELKTFNHYGSGKEAIMKPGLDPFGYFRTMIIGDDGKSHTVKMHRIIAQTFIPNPENKPQVNHIDGNPKNNKVSNLEWNTASENNKHAHRIGLNSNEGSRNPFAKITEAEVREILKSHNYSVLPGKPQIIEAAIKYGYSVHLIEDVVYRHTWRHIPVDNPTYHGQKDNNYHKNNRIKHPDKYAPLRDNKKKV